ncbi:hypothetical protein [Microbispora bryophytorum]|uniref:PIN domain-containing protein n=1 Tax=Microbispora bryophytorum subsp. camponoti TaxID=1677852 RepID=A0ABR8LE10_9ACTN|nr:hypothetical protein [Microbispora camponoti]MBD3147031.1 hypothetical protein [Microbispora camponoti]
MSVGYVLDDVTISELGRGDLVVANLVAALDEHTIRISVPAIALASAQHTLSEAQTEAVHGMIHRLEHVRLEPIASAEDVLRLSAVSVRLTEQQDIPAAHTVAVARYLGFPILATDLKRWEPVRAHLPWQLDIYEISDSD